MLWIKICGLTTSDTVEAAVRAGADAVGFVFAASKRQVTPAHAAMLARAVPAHIARVAVMQHPTQALVDEVCEIFAPDILQTDADDLVSLRVPRSLRIMPVIRDGRALPSTLPARVLYEGKASGAGLTADWSRAQRVAAQTQLVLAGGLNEQNVATAIAAVTPFGIDVSSGVESAPGIKDAHKIEAFIRAARNA